MKPAATYFGSTSVLCAPYIDNSSLRPYFRYNECVSNADELLSKLGSVHSDSVQTAITDVCSNTCAMPDAPNDPWQIKAKQCIPDCVIGLNVLAGIEARHPNPMIGKYANEYKDLTTEQQRKLIGLADDELHRLGVENYRPYNPFLSDSSTPHPKRVMWVIILILVVGLIFVMSQKK